MTSSGSDEGIHPDSEGSVSGGASKKWVSSLPEFCRHFSCWVFLPQYFQTDSPWTRQLQLLLPGDMVSNMRMLPVHTWGKIIIPKQTTDRRDAENTRGALCNNLRQFKCINLFCMGPMGTDCVVAWKMRPSPSLSAAYTSLRTICLVWLMLLDCWCLCEGLGSDLLWQSKGCDCRRVLNATREQQ